MEPNPNIKKLLSAEELQLLERLRKAQIDQRAGVDAPLFAPAKVDDLLCLLKAKVRRNETWYNGIYFTDDGRAFVVGIIDSLTDWNLKKQAEKKIKGLINQSKTPEGFWSSSCLPPDKYSERFLNFMKAAFLSTETEPEYLSMLSDSTSISATTWGELKERAMEPGYFETSVFVRYLKKKEKDTLRRLIAA